MLYLIKHQTNSPLLHIYETALLPLVCQTENKKLITWLLQVPAACRKKSSWRPWKRECIKSLLLKWSHQVSLKNITRLCHLIVSYSILSWIIDLKGGRVVCIFKAAHHSPWGRSETGKPTPLRSGCSNGWPQSKLPQLYPAPPATWKHTTKYDSQKLVG